MIAMTSRHRASKRNWTASIKGEVAWKVARTLVVQGKPASDRRAVLQALQRANETLSEDLRKSKVSIPPWLSEQLTKIIPIVSDQVDREIRENPPTQLPRPVVCPPPLPDIPSESEREQEDVSPKKSEHRRLVRMLRTQQNQIDALSDRVDSLINLICEFLPQLEETVKPTTRVEDSNVVPIAVEGRVPIVAVCGLHGKQRAQVDAQHDHDKVELVYVDTRRKVPRQIGEFDFVIVTRGAGRTWWRQAKERFASISYANSTSDVLGQLDKLVQ